jgi:outer membrane cobalamin receptor
VFATVLPAFVERSSLADVAAPAPAPAEATAAPVRDAEPEPSAEAPRRTSYYETATVVARPIDRATSAVTIIDRAAIETLGVASAAELLRHAPGIDVSQVGPRAGFASAQIRGGEPNFTVVMVDGVPLNDATDQFGGAVNLNAISTDHIERVEIVRGALSSFFGSTGLAGAVNIITRVPTTPELAVRGSVAAGNASYGRVAASVGRAVTGQDVFVGATWEQEERRVADDAFEHAGLQGHARWDLGGAGAIRVAGRFAVSDADDYPEASGGPELGIDATRHSEHENGTGALEWRSSSATRPQGVRLSVSHQALDGTSPGVPSGEIPPSIDETRYALWRGAWTLSLLERSGVHLALGAEVSRESGRSSSQFIVGGDPPGTLDNSYSIDRTNVGVFAEWLIERGPWLVELGARADDPEDVDATLSPRAGVAYRLGEGRTRLRAAVGRAFKLPSFFALASPLGGNPDLDPEIVVGVDAGAEHRTAGGALTLTTGVFFNRYRDLINFDIEQFMSVNEDRVETRGVELGVAWRATARWSLAASVTRQEIDNLDSDAQIRQRPEWYGSLRLAGEVTHDLTLTLDAQAVSERFDQQFPAPDRDRVAGYGLVGAALSWRAAPRWLVRLRADNLLDRDYETFIGFPGPGVAARIDLVFGD